MTSVVDVALPVFGLIGIGAFAAWRGLLDATVALVTIGFLAQ